MFRKIVIENGQITEEKFSELDEAFLNSHPAGLLVFENVIIVSTPDKTIVFIRSVGAHVNDLCSFAGAMYRGAIKARKERENKRKDD